jgi:heat shock protein HtpX
MNRTTLNYSKAAGLFLAPTAVCALLGFAIAEWAGLAVCTAAYILFATISFVSADRMILTQHRAELISRGQAPGLHALVSELSRRAMLPAPALYVLPEAGPQLLVTGRNADRGAIAISKRLPELLNTEELAAVIAHAIAHLRYRETVPMTMVAGLVRGLIAISNFFRRSNLLGPKSFNSEKPDGVCANASLWIPIAPIAAALIRATVYPSRQFRADEASVRLIGDPNPLSAALRKIEALTPDAAPECVSSATAHLFFSHPVFRETRMRMFRTQPTIAERLHRLDALGHHRLNSGYSHAEQAPNAESNSGLERSHLGPALSKSHR